MLVSKSVKLRWNSRNKKRYVDLGYKYTKMGDEFDVLLKDITDYCSAIVECKCDYCGKIYNTQWQSYIHRNDMSKDCCQDVACIEAKAVDEIRAKYGVDNMFQLQSVQDKISDTNIRKYGCANPFQSDEIKQKIKETNIKKYGTYSPMKNCDIINKAKETCLQKYGVDNYSKTNDFRESVTGENNYNWKGGVCAYRYERATKEYAQWRKLVYLKDAYTCQICGQHGGELNAHHIYNWKDNESLRYEVSNGVCLCSRCHILFHRLYKKSNNNKQQLEEFAELWKKDMLNYDEYKVIEEQDKKPVR